MVLHEYFYKVVLHLNDQMVLHNLYLQGIAHN